MNKGYQVERNVQRIDGIKTHLHGLSDEELSQQLFHASARLEGAQADIETLHGELHRRFNNALPLGEYALEGYAEIADCLLPEAQ